MTFIKAASETLGSRFVSTAPLCTFSARYPVALARSALAQASAQRPQPAADSRARGIDRNVHDRRPAAADEELMEFVRQGVTGAEADAQ